MTDVIRVNEADICLLHFVYVGDCDDPEEISDLINCGNQVETVWSDDRSGDTRDLENFELVE